MYFIVDPTRHPQAPGLQRHLLDPQPSMADYQEVGSSPIHLTKTYQSHHPPLGQSQLQLQRPHRTRLSVETEHLTTEKTINTMYMI